MDHYYPDTSACPCQRERKGNVGWVGDASHRVGDYRRGVIGRDRSNCTGV